MNRKKSEFRKLKKTAKWVRQLRNPVMLLWMIESTLNPLLIMG
jgi:hypothetical protein